MSKILVSGGLVPTTKDTLLDARTRVATFSEIANIENPARFMVITVEDTGKKYEVKKLTSKIIGGIVVENSTIDINDPEALVDLGLAEELRSEDEKVRQSNEKNRIEAENLRKTAEDSRKVNETNRVSAEGAREASERTRVSSEETRNANEQTRNSNETKRQSQESTRQSQESARQTNESARKTNESARKEAESERKTEETSRRTAELSRSSAENTRAKNEQNRTTAENTRSSAEDRRVANETQRTTNETARNNAELSREQAEGNRASTFNTLKGQMQTTIQEGQTAVAATEKATSDAQKVVDEYDTKVSEQDSKLSELGSKAEWTVVSTYSLMNGGTGNASNSYKVRSCALDVRGKSKFILTTDRPLAGNSYYEYEYIFVEEEQAIGQFIAANNNPSGFTVFGQKLHVKQGEIIEVPSNASAIVVAIYEIPNRGSEGDIALRTTNFGNYRLGYSINTVSTELPNIYKSIEDRNNTIAFCRSEIRNGTPENSGNAYAIRSIMLVPVNKGDCVIVQFNGYTLGEGQKFAYGIAGVSDNSKNTDVVSIRTEGIGYSETNAVNNSYIVTHDDTRYVLVCVTVKNSDGTYTSLQPYTNYDNSALAVKVIRKDIINAIIQPLNKKIDTNIQNVNIISGSQLPNINILDRTLDLSDDPVIMVGDKYYMLKGKIETDKFRKIQIKPSDSTSTAVNIVFNTKTFEIVSKYYGYTLNENEVIIASFRIYNGAGKGAIDFIKGVSIPSEYTIDGAYPQLAKDIVLNLSELNSDMFSNYTSNRCNIVFGNVHKVSVSLSDYSTYRFAVQVRTDRNLPYNSLAIDSGWKNGDYAHTNSVKHWLSYSPVYYTAVVISKVDDSAISQEEAFSALSSLYVEYIGGNVQNGSLPFSAIDGIANNINNRKENITAKTGYTFIAHRGFHLSGIPENSLDSYEYAAKYGFKYAETDFCPTLDGELVLMHDESINRTMRNKDYSALSTTVLVKDKTLQELRTNYVLASSDVRMRKPIPTLEEFLITCKNVGIYPIMEIKNFGVEQSHILKAFEMASEILGDGNFGFTSFSPELLDYARTLSDEIKLWYIINSAGLIGKKNTVDGSSREHHNNVWYPATTSYGLTAESVKRHRKKGISTAVWTIDSNRFNEMGQYLVDQIATDNIAPDLYGSVGIYINSDIDNNRLSIEGDINSDKTITLDTGKSLSCTHERFEFGKYYTKISFSGVIRVNTPQSAVEVNSAECNGIYIEQGFLIKKEPNITITAVSDSVINNIEIAACSIK